MKAERDDAPYHLRSKRNNHWRFLAILSMGSIGTLAAMFMFAKPVTIDVNKLADAIQVMRPQQPQKPPDGPNLHEPVPTPTAPLNIQPPKQNIHAAAPTTRPTPATEQPRQTVFNDRNYTPRNDINTMESVNVTRYEKQPQQQQPPTRRLMQNTWSWTNHHGTRTERVGGEFIWYEAGGRIDWRSVCSNEQRGSLRYRDCRKGAKVTFARICGRYKPACMAANHYNPL